MALKSPLSPETVVQRIDEMMQELSELRRVVLRQLAAPEGTQALAKELYGALGQGSWDEWDTDLDWRRFET